MDPYTRSKFLHLLSRDTVAFSLQGLDSSPDELAGLQPGPASREARPLREAIKRCIVELSLKEVLLGRKPIATANMPIEPMPCEITLLATRQIRMSRRGHHKQLVAAVRVRLDNHGLTVLEVRRSPWQTDTVAALDFVAHYPFLQPDGKAMIPDGQFWMMSDAGERLTVWSGAFVPKIIVNHDYESIEAALAEQRSYLRMRAQEGRGTYYSKAKIFNLLPYYMSLYRRGAGTQGERTGSRLPVQDCGSYLRVFVPPAGGIKGSGDSLSGFRDVMVYDSQGSVVDHALHRSDLVTLYLHAMTTGLLVAGDNSKMTIFEKLAHLALEN